MLSTSLPGRLRGFDASTPCSFPKATADPAPSLLHQQICCDRVCAGIASHSADPDNDTLSYAADCCTLHTIGRFLCRR